MDSEIQVIVLVNGTTIISKIAAMVSELGEPDCKLVNPFKIDAEGNLTPWPDVTDQREMMIHSDSILTIVDPKPEIVEKYLELTA